MWIARPRLNACENDGCLSLNHPLSIETGSGALCDLNAL
jgi:hypothetical protein